MNRPGIRLVIGCALLLVGLIVRLPHASAAVIQVTTTADGGPGSLRAAFTTANGNGQDDEIVLASSATYLLTICGAAAEEDANADGDLDHTPGNALTITGNGATIRNTCPDERVIEQLGTGLLTLREVTITGGSTADNGGGIQATSSDVTVANSSVSWNSSDFGGGIYAPSGDTTVISSTVSMNTAGPGSTGGGIHGSAGDVIVTSSTFAGNTAGDDGGGIRTSAGSITITGSTFAGNQAAAQGGGLRTSGGDVTIMNSTLTGNTAGQDGGAIIDVSGSVLLNNTTVVGNDASFGGDALAVSSTAQIANTILSGPQEDCGGGGTFISNGYNIGSDASCNLTSSGDQPGTDAQLLPLADNGGQPRPTRWPRGARRSTPAAQLPLVRAEPRARPPTNEA